MIVSHKHRFIFIKTGKTGGTSIEIALSRHCGEDDVITPVNGLTPRNYLAPLSQYSPIDVARLVLRRRRKVLFEQHSPAREIRQRLPEHIWDGYFKFTVTRNPWDRVISSYYWRTRGKGEDHGSISDFVRDPRNLRYLHEGRGWGMYTIEGQVVVDQVLRYENLLPELAEVCDRLQHPGLDLPRAKGEYRADRRHYADVLSPEDRDLINEVFADEIAHMQYVWEDAPD